MFGRDDQHNPQSQHQYNAFVSLSTACERACAQLEPGQGQHLLPYMNQVAKAALWLQRTTAYATATATTTTTNTPKQMSDESHPQNADNQMGGEGFQKKNRSNKNKRRARYIKLTLNLGSVS